MAATTRVDRSGLWKAIALVSLSANLTGIAAWLTFGNGTINRSEVNEMILAAPYPWKEDRKLVLDHLGQGEQHESDGEKRQRIRDELRSFGSRYDGQFKSLENRLDDLREGQREIRKKIEGMK